MSEEKYKYQIRATTKFKKAAKLAAKRSKDTQKLKDIVEKLAKGVPLAPAPFLRSKCPLSSPKSGAERGLLCPEKLPIQHSGIHFLSE